MSRKKTKAFLTGVDFDIAVDIDKGPAHFTYRFDEEQIPVPAAIKANIAAACSIINYYREAPAEADLLVADVIDGVVLMLWMELKRKGYVKPVNPARKIENQIIF